jgi:uncharacterized 2Fe-2S/4Fe-4S cluster protein (DUF4445 family)
VRLIEGAAEPSPADLRHLSDRVDLGWRLSCQTTIGHDLEVEVPRLLKTPKAATMGVGRFVLLEPNARRWSLRISPPSLRDPRSALGRIRDALELEGLEVRAGSNALPRLAETMAEDTTEITATVVGDLLVDVERGSHRRPPLAVAIDLGTTTVVASLVDLEAGTTIGVGSALNGQARHGADVIARIGHAMAGRAELDELAADAVGTVNRLIGEVCSEAGASAADIVEAIVVGNATMLHLLLGVDPSSIALSPFVATFLDPQDLAAAEVGIHIHPGGRVVLFPSIGPYAGADIVADILATGLAREPETRLLVDVGTNGEIVVGNRDRVVATAAPAGPAFEGGQILHGMRATEGAIESVTLENGLVELQVIGGPNARPQGICGSGLIDVVAQLRLVGLVDESGSLLTQEDSKGHPLADRLVQREGVRAFALTDEVFLTQLDIRELQSAKGAVSTGIEVAMETLGVAPSDLDEVMLAGSFGSYIQPQSARVLGLVPRVAVERIRAVGNTASEGAKMALLSFRERQVAFEIPSFVDYVELSGAADFNERFIANLAFPPFQGTAQPEALL